MLLLAQVAPDPQALYNFLVVVGFLAATGSSLGVYWSTRRTQKREVSFPNEYATRAEHAELKNRVDKIADEIVRGFERVDGKRSTSIAGLHDDLEARTNGLRLELKEDVKGIHGRIDEISSALHRVEGLLQK